LPAAAPPLPPPEAVPTGQAGQAPPSGGAASGARGRRIALLGAPQRLNRRQGRPEPLAIRGTSLADESRAQRIGVRVGLEQMRRPAWGPETPSKALELRQAR
jgi:hypothetical protein